MIKFGKKIDEFKYILSFDLAKIHTGWALVDTKEHDVPMCGEIVCEIEDDRTWRDMKDKISSVIKSVKEFCGENKFFVIKEKLPNQSGRFTTISALQALAQAHAAFAIACEEESVEVYDYLGVHSTTTKAYFRSVTGIQNPTKEDIYENIVKYYNLVESGLTLDITDAIGCVLALRKTKWNNDIKEQIKELKKSLKKYKTEKKQNEVLSEIERLKSLMIEED